jgi:hypothetical protein
VAGTGKQLPCQAAAFAATGKKFIAFSGLGNAIGSGTGI